MDDNSFLKNYKRKAGEQQEERGAEAPAPVAAPVSRRYEEKSGFVRTRRGDTGAPSNRGGPNLLVPVIIGAVVVIGIVAGLIWYLNRGIDVIDFAGWSLNDAQLWADAKGVNLQVDEQFDDKVDSGKIISQNPAKGEKTSKGSFVKLAVSKGHDLTVELPLPDLMNMTGDGVQAWADQNFMAKVRVTTEYSSDVAAGKVISYEINDNTVVDKVTRNTPIYVVVSKGPEDLAAVLITVPDFKVKTISECYSFANENGLVLEVVEQYDDYAPKGGIIAQSVKADEKVRKGEKITLTVSKGKKITVPDFSAYSKAMATAEATQLGIPMTAVDKYSGEPAGDFISQSIPADSVYEDGDVLELDYSLGNTIVVANYVGQTRDAIETWAKGLNDLGASIKISATNTQSESPKGTIIYQNKANTVIGIKTTIRITVSLGKAVFAPDFVAPEGSGYDVAVTRDEAMAMCEAAGIVPVFVSEKKAGRLPGEIWYQSVAAGREVNEGATITLKYNPANTQVTVPDFKGMTQDEILAGGYNMKFSLTFVVADVHVEGYDGTVYKQSVPVGTTVVVGSAITVTISPATEPEPTQSTP